MTPEPLTWDRLRSLAHGVDPYRHRTDAVAFAVRAGYSNDVAHRFFALLCITNQLGESECYPDVLREMLDTAPEPAQLTP